MFFLKLCPPTDKVRFNTAYEISTNMQAMAFSKYFSHLINHIITAISYHTNIYEHPPRLRQNLKL